MKLRQRIANLIAPTAKNTAGVDLAREFLRHGNRRQLMGNWSVTGIGDRDMYTGYFFGALHKRANGVVELAENNLMTKASPAIMEQAKARDEVIEHPYLPIIDESDFQNDDLWYNYSTYMDLEGVYYLLAVRNILRKADGTLAKLGEIQYFRLLNPYNIVAVRNTVTGEVGGYQEYRNGLVRDLPVEMVIPIGRLNPFSEIEPFAIADAAKDDQFTLRSAKNYTNNAIENNINAPGIIGTGIEMNPDRFKNFRARVLNHEKGEPLFANGSGKLTWQSMQSELEKAALDKINEIGLTGIIATTGASKTSLGIEQSGVTRDTAKVQHDQFVSDHVMPQLRRLIGALNQDYRRYYNGDYKRTRYLMFIDNPLGSDRDAEMKDVEIREKGFDLYTSLVQKGYDTERAAKYTDGEISLAQLGEPTRPPTTPDDGQEDEGDDDTGDQKAPGKQAAKAAGHGHTCTDLPNIAKQQTEEESRAFVLQREGVLQNAVVQVQNRLLAAVVDKITNNAFKKESDIVNKKDKAEAVNQLDVALVSFFLSMMPFLGEQVIKRRLQEFSDLEITAYPSYNLDREARNYIDQAAKRAATSHIDTVLDDVLEAVRKSAIEGVSRDQLVSAIRQTFTGVSKQRATLIAKTETYRAFTRSQFDADRQFLNSVGLRKKAKKKWRTRSGRPCAFCQSKAAEPAIPFDQPFADLGDVLSADFVLKDGSTSVRKMPITYEVIQSGGLHPRCECIYELIIEE